MNIRTTNNKRSTAILWLALVNVLTAVGVSAQQQLLWSDEFNAGGRNSPNSNFWSFDTGNGGWGNGELQTYTSDLSNAVVEDGFLRIIARKDAATSPPTFTSARLKTENKIAFLYGTLEARIKVPDVNAGLWPAFWTLGFNVGEVGWPKAGEVDIMEVGQGHAIQEGVVNRRVVSAAHWDYQGDYATYARSYDNPTDLSEDFHVYRLEWTPDSMTTFVDDALVWQMPIGPQDCDDCDELHHPHFILLNMAVGGGFTSGSSSSSSGGQPDPCNGISCPQDEICNAGTCFNPFCFEDLDCPNGFVCDIIGQNRRQLQPPTGGEVPPEVPGANSEGGVPPTEAHQGTCSKVGGGYSSSGCGGSSSAFGGASSSNGCSNRGPDDITAPLPGEMLIDWVRLYHNGHTDATIPNTPQPTPFPTTVGSVAKAQTAAPTKRPTTAPVSSPSPTEAPIDVRQPDTPRPTWAPVSITTLSPEARTSDSVDWDYDDDDCFVASRSSGGKAGGKGGKAGSGRRSAPRSRDSGKGGKGGRRRLSGKGKGGSGSARSGCRARGGSGKGKGGKGSGGEARSGGEALIVSQLQSSHLIAEGGVPSSASPSLGIMLSFMVLGLSLWLR